MPVESPHHEAQESVKIVCNSPSSQIWTEERRSCMLLLSIRSWDHTVQLNISVCIHQERGGEDIIDHPQILVVFKTIKILARGYCGLVGSGETAAYHCHSGTTLTKLAAISCQWLCQRKERAERCNFSSLIVAQKWYLALSSQFIHRSYTRARKCSSAVLLDSRAIWRIAWSKSHVLLSTQRFLEKVSISYWVRKHGEHSCNSSFFSHGIPFSTYQDRSLCLTLEDSATAING